MKRSLCRVLAAVLGLLYQQTSAPGAIVFFDQATFLGAVSPAHVENFETAPLSGSEESSALPAIDFNFFTASSVPAAVKVLGTPLLNGNHNTTPGGARYLSFDTDTGIVSPDVTLSFVTPAIAMGLFLIDIEQGAAVNINGEDYLVPATASGGQIYFGIIADTPFTSVFLDAGTTDSHWSIDDLATASVPEPTATILVAINFAAMVLRRRRWTILPAG